MWRLLRWIAIAAIAALVLLGRSRKKTVHEIDDEEQVRNAHLADFVSVVSRVNDESDEDYRRSVEALRSNPKGVLEEAERLLSERSEASFALRHTTLMAVAAIQNEIALGLLERVALNPQPLPPIDDPEGPLAEARVQQDILALDALDGIGVLAREGSSEALDRLVVGAARGSRAVALASIAVLGSRTEWGEQHARARASLPRDHADLALARYTDVSDVPQVRDPRQHLDGVEQGIRKSPPIDLDRDHSSRDLQPAGGAPRVNKESGNG